MEVFNDEEAAEARTSLMSQSIAFTWAQVCEDAAALVRKLALSVTSTASTGSFEEVRIFPLHRLQALSNYTHLCLCQ